PAPGRQEDGEESGFEQQDIPLKAEERLPHDAERKIGCEKQDEAENGRDAGNEEQGENRTGAAEKMQERVARIEPEEGREGEVTLPAELRVRRRQQLRHRRQTPGADQSVHLYPEREKRDQIDQAEEAQKPATGLEIGGAPDIFAPEQRGYCMRQRAMPGNE